MMMTVETVTKTMMIVCMLVVIMVQTIKSRLNKQTINFLSAQYPQFGGRIPRLSGKALDCYLLATNTEKMNKVINFAACIKNNI